MEPELTGLDGVSRRRLTRRHVLHGALGLLATPAIAGLLAACGGDDDDDDGGDATATTGTAPEGTATEASGGDATATTGTGGDASATAGTGAEATATTATDEPTATADSGSSGGSGGSLINARASDADSLDPQRTIAGASWFVFSNIFDTLISKNMDQEFEPLIAESFEFAEDGLSMTFVIREGMTFHDGSPVNAEAVKFTFDRATNPDAPSQALGFIDAYEGSELVDENTIVFTFKEPTATFISNIAVAYFGILPPEATEAAGDDFGKNPVGSGPWVFQEWLEGEQITLTPFADYQNVRSYVENTGAPLADELVLRVIPEASTQVIALETGEINHLELPPSEVANFEGDDEYELHRSAGSTVIAYIDFASLPEGIETGVPVYKPPMDDPNVRLAVGHAIDADVIIESVLAGLADRNYGLMPNGLFAYDPAIEEFGIKYDPEQAATLLEESGWTVSGDGVREKDGEQLEMLLWTFNLPGYDRVAQVMQNQLGEVGINVTIEVLESGTLIARAPENEWDILISGVGWPEADILYIMAFNLNAGITNYRNPEYIDLITQARQTNDLAERRELYFEAQKIALADVAAIPLWSPATVTAVRSSVKGFKLGPDSINVWTDAYVEE
jgi:peptide/nickel transport system substrate-binding protein